MKIGTELVYMYPKTGKKSTTHRNSPSWVWTSQKARDSKISKIISENVISYQIWSDEALLRPSGVFLDLPNVFLCDQVSKWTLKMVGNSPRDDTENWEESTCRTLGRIAETMENPWIFYVVRATISLS